VKPRQRSTGSGGYFGKLGSRHIQKVEPFADTIVRAWMHAVQRPTRGSAGWAGSAADGTRRRVSSFELTAIRDA
jgi:hypothetical protein